MKKTSISFDIPLPLRERITQVLRDAVSETFAAIFGIEVNSASHENAGDAGQDLTCRVTLTQDDLEFSVYFRFSKTLLRQIVAAYYPPEAISEQEAFADAAGEIANIVGCNLKAFLNSQGYGLSMPIPCPAAPREPMPGQQELRLYFTAQEHDFRVDVRLSGKEASPA